MINFINPNIFESKYNSASITLEKHTYTLRIDNEVMMQHNPRNNISFSQLMGSVWLAKGKTICTGLGMLLRESMLLSNPLVTEIIVLENSKDLIDLQNIMNPKIMSQINVVHCDANNYQGECETLLVDHYEDLSQLKISVDSVVYNISHKILWFWTLESSVSNYYAQADKYPTIPKLNDKQIKNLVDLYRKSINLHSHFVPTENPIDQMIVEHKQKIEDIKNEQI